MAGVVDEELAGLVWPIAGAGVLGGAVVANVGATSTLGADAVIVHPFVQDGATKEFHIGGERVPNIGAGDVSVSTGQIEGGVAEEGKSSCIGESRVEASGKRIGVCFRVTVTEVDAELLFDQVGPDYDGRSDNILTLAWVVRVGNDFVPDALDLLVIGWGEIFRPNVRIRTAAVVSGVGQRYLLDK